MKIDITKLKKSTSEVPADCKTLIDKLTSCNADELLVELKKIESWTYGKCELYHWVEVLNVCDHVLEEACKKESKQSWILGCDLPDNKQRKDLLLWTLHFTTLLIEHSFSRHLYNSMEHLTSLLASSDMNVVLGVLNLLYMFSKRSNFITRLPAEKRQELLSRLLYLAESWGGNENGFGLAKCCSDVPISQFPLSATTLHFDYYAESQGDSVNKKNNMGGITCVQIHVSNVDLITKSPSAIMEELMESYNVPPNKQMVLFTHIRLAHGFSDYKKRLQFIQARLQALSVLVYSSAVQDNLGSLLYNGFLEELVEVLELKQKNLMEIKAAALRTLTAIIHLDRNPSFPKLNTIIDVTEASSYHGFLPVLVRSCISSLINSTPENPPFPLPFATALFSFLYHLASYEVGVEALVSCGMMESLLKVINWRGSEPEHNTFVTRAVRVIDLITNLEMHAFQMHNGLPSFINRLEIEINDCKKEQPFVYQSQIAVLPDQSIGDETFQSLMVEPASNSLDQSASGMDVESVNVHPGPSCLPNACVSFKDGNGKLSISCIPQRAALLKSILNFLKKAIGDSASSDGIRHLMDGSLPSSLKHIISNAEYYGPSLFLLATDTVAMYVFQEPSLLSSLQENGLTDTVLYALLVKNVPATREVLASLPNVFSALCLNAQGLETFVNFKPFEKLFRVLLSPDYLPAMRRRRSSDPMGDTASNLGNAMDELMRHQPSLRKDATAAIVKLLTEICNIGNDPKYICCCVQSKSEQPSTSYNRTPVNEGGSSDEEEEEEEDESSSSHATGGNPQIKDRSEVSSSVVESTEEKISIPLIDYILNVMKFVEAILTNNATDDHCREFVAQNGLTPLMNILSLQNLPIDFPVTPACHCVASVCKSILNLASEHKVLKEGLQQLNSVLQSLEPLHLPIESPGGSVLLRELAANADLTNAFNSAASTPLLHAMSAAHGYIMMFVHVCRSGQSDIRSICMSHWGSELGLSVLRSLSQLYTSLVWESTILLALCNEDGLPPGCLFGREDLDKLVPNDSKSTEDLMSSSNNLIHSIGEFGSNGVTSAMQALTTEPVVTMDIDEQGDGSDTTDKSSKNKVSNVAYQKVKLIKPLLGASSRLGRALAELFGLLVKLCVGSPLRQRRGQTIAPIPSPPTVSAQSVASALAILLTEGLSWEPPLTSPAPKFRLTYFICSMGFTSPMLFDEKKFPFNLMLQKFKDAGGQKAFFDAFKWAISSGSQGTSQDESEQPTLPDGIAEFLESWLALLEKLVNPKSVLETPHILPARSAQVGYKPIDPLKYLISIQKDSFEAVMLLWNKKPLEIYGPRIAEYLLTILCHILKGGAIIQEKLKKDKEPANTNSSNSAITTAGRRRDDSLDADVDPHHLQQLMDMGFSRENCVEALHYTRNLEQATEYLLSHPPLLRAPAAEDDFDAQVTCAIAMSLNVNVINDQSKDVTKELSDGDKSKVKENDTEPLSDSVINEFTQNMLEGCFKLSDCLQDTVYKVCDLLVAVATRNGEKWRDDMLLCLIKEVNDNLPELTKLAENVSSQHVMNELSEGKHALRTARRLHLFTLLFEKMKIPAAQIVEKAGLIGDLISLISLLHVGMASYSSTTPCWLAPAVLFIDLFQKVSIGSVRRSALSKVTNHIWKWYEVTSGKWCTYSTVNNKIIDDAFWAGEPSVRVTAGRRRYMIQFITMTQINEETGNRRPIMLALKEPDKPKEEKLQSTENNSLTITNPGFSPIILPINYSSSSLVEPSDRNVEPLTESSDQASISQPKPESTSDIDEPAKIKEEDMDVDGPSKKNKDEDLPVVSGLLPHEAEGALKACVNLISIPLDPDTLHAILRLCLRLSRCHKHALLFAEMDGVHVLLKLTHTSEFSGFTSLATLLIRHIMEEPCSLRYTMEKVIRGSTNVRARELHYLLRALAPAASRNPELFEELAKAIFRVDLALVAKRGDELEDQRLLIKSIVPKGNSCPPVLSSVVKNVLGEMLNALACKYEVTEPTHSEKSPVGNDKPKDNDQLEIPDSLIAHQTPGNPSQATVPKESLKDDDSKVKVPLFSKSAICRLLAELVKSYMGCAKFISEYVLCADAGELVNEDCNILAFILDNLLPPCQVAGDKDTPAWAKTLLAALASCNHSPDAQNALVAEVKASMIRTLNLPESVEKHSKIQSLTALILLMIESCPSSVTQACTSSFKQQTMSMNNIVKIMMRRGLVTDLAKIPHSLDLSSPHMATTVNSSLKPLETLSRIINLPLNSSIPRLSSKLKSASETNVDEMTSVQTGTSNSEATHAQHDDNIGDTDNTDHDISTVTESLDPNSESQPHEENQEERDGTLDEIIDQLLERDGVHHEDSLLGDVLITNHPSQGPMESDDTLHDSQMMTQHESEFETEDTQCEDEHGGSSTSGSDHSEEGDEDAEDEDEDDEEEDEDEEGSTYEDDGEGDEFREVDEAFYRASLPPFSDAETEGIVMVQYPEVDVNSPSLAFSDNNRSMQLPIALNDETNPSSDTLGQSIAPPSTAVTPIIHPLLSARQSNDNNAVAVGRVHRAGRQGRYRYIQLTANLRDSNPPAILQRLLGPGFAHDVLHLTASHRFTSGMREARMLFSENDFRLLTGGDDSLSDFQAHEDGLLGSQSTLSSIPTALVRWAEASRVLDGDSVHDCLTIIKPRIVKLLEKIRDEELAERKYLKKKEEEASAQVNKILDDELKKCDAMDLNVSTDNRMSVESSNLPVTDSSAVTTTAPSTDVNVITENFAESIVESVLRPAFSTSTTTPISQPSTAVIPVTSTIGFYPTSESLQVTQSSTYTSSSPLGLLPVDLRSFFDILASEIVYPENSSAATSGDVTYTVPSHLSPPTTLPTLCSTTSVVPTVATPIISAAPWIVAAEPMRLFSTMPSSQSSISSNSIGSENVEAHPFNLTVEQSGNEHVPTSDSLTTAANASDLTEERSVFLPCDSSTTETSNTEAMEVETNVSGLKSSGSPVQNDTQLEPVTNPLTTNINNETANENNVIHDQAVVACSSSSVEPSQAAVTTVGSDGVDYSEILGNIEIPEGVDPAFLAALPDDMRQEVIAEQLRLQRLKQRAEAQSQAAVGTTSSSSLEVNPEFLAALPPNIQEEVLAQQRLEQQRQQAATSNPEEPVDPANFISTLPPALRQTVLSDMEESQMAVLPPDLAAEAQNLRREWEARNRQIMQDRMFTSNGTATLSSILRNTVGRLGGRFPFQAVSRGQWNGWNSRTATATIQPPNLRLKGRQLLDHEALSCLLILLFIDDSKLNTNKLHRVMRNLCYHAPTRDWVIKSLLSILDKAGNTKGSDQTFNETRTRKIKSGSSQESLSSSSGSSQTWLDSKPNWSPTWLNISMDAALGCRANVFVVSRNTQGSGKKQSFDKQCSQISLHPQASPIICRHVLDTLISLAKSFPNQFLPSKNRDLYSILSNNKDSKEKDREAKEGIETKCKTNVSSNNSSAGSVSGSKHGTDFWDMLGRLDSMSASKKGKSITRTHSGTTHPEEYNGCASFESSPLGQLIGMLSQPVIQRSSVLTDKLLRLLALISLGLPYVINSSKSGDKSRETSIDSDVSHIIINENLLKLAVDVLTSKNCSEEGLEDGTALLLRLSQGPTPTREMVLNLLLCGATELGHTVQAHIFNLWSELQDLNKKTLTQSDEDSGEPAESVAKVKSYKGVLRDRFTKEAVIITVPSRPKGGSGGELQLQSMMALTSKTSSQSFFLRILKVVIQLREAARLASLKDRKKSIGNPMSLGTSEAVPGIDGIEEDGATPCDSGTTCSSSNPVETTPNTNALNLEMSSDPNLPSNAINTNSNEDVDQGSTPMEVDNTLSEDNSCDKKIEEVLPSLSEQLNLEELWFTLSECLKELAGTPDHHAVLVLQPAVEAFFLVHASGIGKDDKTKQNKSESKESQLSHLQQDLAPLSPIPASNDSSCMNIGRENSVVQINPDLPPDTKKFLEFAETHRTVLNQILRQSTVHLADGPFSVLVDHTRILDFDVKRRYFRTELERMDEGIRREDLAIHVKREHVFEDSFRELHRRSPEEWKNRFYVVFEGEEGQDAGGLLREWYMIISREIFNPMYALFTTSPGDRVTYMINPSSHCNSNHLSYFKFVGRVIAKAVYDNKLLECYFTRSFYKHILGKAVRYTDMESEDYSFYQGLAFLVNHHVSELGYDLTFSTEVQEFGVTEVRDLIPNGRNIPVVESSKLEYIRLVCQMKMTGAIRKQLNAFLEGFYDIIPKRLISIFNEQELELLISGLPTIDIDDLKSNTEYHKYQANSLQIQWLWRALRSFDQADRAKFLQFVTGTSKVPLQGFSSLEGMNGIQKFQVHRDDRSTERLPSAHTCFNQLDLPVYETYDKLKSMLLKAINECSEGFGFA